MLKNLLCNIFSIRDCQESLEARIQAEQKEMNYRRTLPYWAPKTHMSLQKYSEATFLTRIDGRILKVLKEKEEWVLESRRLCCPRHFQAHRNEWNWHLLGPQTDRERCSGNRSQAKQCEVLWASVADTLHVRVSACVTIHVLLSVKQSSIAWWFVATKSHPQPYAVCPYSEALWHPA
jgi:hypothetical protein